MNTPSEVAASDDFAATLVRWQRQHGRHDLPWQTGEAYGVWVSEIMLQQTQVQTVIGYYARFMQRFPTLAALAAADEAAVMESWSGLGYYARARNLHRAAREVMTRFGGDFPRTVDDIESLPGIGRSTASAIATFCFGARAPILDGNVKRVFARVFGIDGFPGTRAVEQRMWALAHELMPDQDGAPYTQALMDLGATVCTRNRPRCDACPVAGRCVARAQGRQRELPAPRPARVRPLRLVHALLLRTPDAVLLERRPGQGIWGGLLSLPELAAQSEAEALAEAQRWLAVRGLAAHQVQVLPAVSHGFTHFELRLVPLHAHLAMATPFAADSTLHWQPLGTLATAALPAPVRRLLDTLVPTGHD
jgi:A/G-specific adenine glycosylase